MRPSGALERSKKELMRLLAGTGLQEKDVSVSVGVLRPEEAIGRPQRRDFPILEGKERMVEAAFLSSKGHAFTDAPTSFGGTLREVLELPLVDNARRAVYLAVVNAVCRHLGVVRPTLHCRDEDPEACGRHIADRVFYPWGLVRVGLVGFNPAIAAHLVRVFGKKFVIITDRNPRNVGVEKAGVVVWDSSRNEEMIGRCRVILVTGTTLTNGTFDDLMGTLRQYHRDYWIYGVTATGVAHLLGLNHLCPFARET